MFHTIQRQLKLFLLITFGSPDQLRLLKHLLPNNRYKPIARPVQNDSHTLLVTINLSLQQIINFMWNDYSLRWKPEDFGNIQTLRIPSTQIWIPDIFLYNTADEKFDTRAKVNAVVQYDGVNLTVESSKGQLDAYVKSAEWDLEDFSATNNVTKYDCCPNMYPYVLYTIRMRRRSLYYFTSIVVPCFLISCMTPLGFLLSPDSGEKLTLHITTLLTVVMFSLLLSEILPPSSNAIPIITVYFMCIMIMSAVSVVASVLVLSLHLRNSSNYTMPSWVRNYICNYLAWLLRMKRPNHDLSWRAIRHRWTFSKQESNNINGSIDNHHHSKISSEPLLNNTFELLSTNVINVDKEPLEFAISSVTEIHGSRHHQNTSNELYTCNMEMIRSELRIIISQLAILINYFQQKEKDANESQDWQFVAMVIDRLCLVIFTVIMLLFTALTFLNV
ncbi:unnamed protein product [Rotaria sordida]|uniref:Uncharacterized protein n=1 Tax=Rotaria sordida TaxID=392033 RepID=A0A818YYS5_9BILA|nr:unnamed protein product [Rotaria sordida]